MDVHTSHRDPADLTRQIVASNCYLTLATVSEDGRPWSSPVFFAPGQPGEFLLAPTERIADYSRGCEQWGLKPMSLEGVTGDAPRPTRRHPHPGAAVAMKPACPRVASVLGT